MNVFVPWPDARASLRDLDTQRLAKQSVETYQLVLRLLQLRPVRDDSGQTTGFERDDSVGWQRHPVAAAWRGAECGLLVYQYWTAVELKRRPKLDGGERKNSSFDLTVKAAATQWSSVMASRGDPTWWGDPDVHRSHRSNLLRKDPAFYCVYACLDDTDPGEPYVWPLPAPDGDDYLLTLAKVDLRRLDRGEFPEPTWLTSLPRRAS